MVDMVFLVFKGFFVSSTGQESFSLRPEKFSKRFSFGGGRVRFSLLCFPFWRACEVSSLLSLLESMRSGGAIFFSSGV